MLQINRKKILLSAGITAILFSALYFYQNKNTSAQIDETKNTSARITKTKKTSAWITKIKDVKDFTKAAVENKNLQYSQTWTFGRKVQKGWYLYVPLIQHTLETDAEPQTPEFAEKISEWQIKNNLIADGVLSRETLYSFVSYWQSRRTKPIILATEEQIITAPISNFYDPTRSVELLKVEKETFAAYKKMIDAAKADERLNLKFDGNGNLSEEEKVFKLISTYRSPEYQASLRKREPNAGRGQLAFVSPHFTGRALDIYVGGEPVTTKDFNRAIQIRTPAYKWLVKNAERFGFIPYFYEPWHWEYVGK
jgi:LAS superfamily LD-carboxypeptidase LdcB